MPIPDRWRLIWPVAATLIVPLAAAWFAYPEKHVPPGFGVFPPAVALPVPGFSWPYFLTIAAAALGGTLFLACPTWFGFRPPCGPVVLSSSGKLPAWFWLGLALMLGFWWIMWARPAALSGIVYFAFTPMWAGFILVLDGLVFRRTGGRSLLASRPRTLCTSALVSIAGWAYCEYYDYFVLGNWTYPNGRMPALGSTAIIMLYLAAYTTVFTALFEWYTLLATFPRLAGRYARGPRLRLPAHLMVWGGFGLIVALVFKPHFFFWGVWIGPLAVIGGQMLRLGVWTPLTAIAHGNWTPAVLIALGSLLNGFLWEMWNYGSAHPNVFSSTMPVTPANPHFWVYAIPYVDTVHLFSEMPLLGYLGYLPLGLFAWVVYAWAGAVFGFDASLNPDASEAALVGNVMASRSTSW